MKLEKFKKDNNLKNILLTLGIVILILGGGLILYRSYALYEEKQTYNVLKGTIPNFNIVNNKYYGIKRKLDETSSSWERIEDSVGLEANAQIGTTEVKNDFDDIYPWSDIISYNYDTENKQVTAYYGEETFKFDGSNGEVLTKIPEFYYKRYQDDEYEYIYISDQEEEGFIKSEEFSVGRYTMSGDSSRVHSRSGYAPLTNVTITNFRNYARNLGEGFGQIDWHYFILQMLYLVEYADYNSQAKLGKGYSNISHTAPVKSGECDFLGMKSGSLDGNDNTSMIYRGIEDIFGNGWQFVDGINIKDKVAYICYDSDKYAVDKFDDGYTALGYVNASNAGFVSKLGYDSSNPIVALPIETVGSSNTYMTDQYHGSADGSRIVIVGGDFSDNVGVGLWYWGCVYNSSFHNIRSRARLIKTK